MLGRRDPQASYFDANVMPHRVAPDSFYGRMAEVCAGLFHDEDLKDMYDPSNGRPSLPPSLLCGVLLLQYHDDVSDDEAVERVLYDLRWKIALHLPLDFPAFDPSSLSYFRKRLAENGHERYAFDRFLAVGRAAGFLPDRVTVLIDTTAVKGAGAVQDTFTLVRKSIRQLLRSMGLAPRGKRHGLSREVQRLLATYVDRDRKAKIDWSDPAQRAAQLKVLVQDAEAALALASAHDESAEVRATGWLLTKILGDDVETDQNGDPQIGQGTAEDRIISTTDPAMRHGHKSKSQRFDGFKTAVSIEPTSDLILDVADLPANSGDGQALMPALARIEEHVGVTVVRAIGDGAFPTGANLAACAEHGPHPIDLMGPLMAPKDAEVAKSAFQMDLEGQTATCPTGHTVAGVLARQHGRPLLRFEFPRATCQACPLFARCVKSKKTGRTLVADEYEVYRQAARRRQETRAFKAWYRKRSAVERKQAELVRHGLRKTRYIGMLKRELQRLWMAAMVNLKRLFRLAEQRGQKLVTLFQPTG
jgi:transposase